MSVGQKGRDFLVGVVGVDAGSPEVITLIRSCRNTEFNGTDESVDVTQKDSKGKRRLLQGAGVQGYELTMDGVFRNQPAHLYIAQKFNAQEFVELVVSDAVSGSPEEGAGNQYRGLFQITAISRSGTH